MDQLGACYYCGKPVDEKDVVMKNVQVGWFNSERKPFHMECWKRYHGVRVKKDAIGCGAVVVGAFLFFGYWLFLLAFGPVGLIGLILGFALLIGLAVAYYRIEE